MVNDLAHSANGNRRVGEGARIKTHGSFNRWLVDALGLVDVVGASVGLDGAAPLGARGRVVRPEGLDDVVLDQRAPCPAVDGEVLWYTPKKCQHGYSKSCI